MALRCDTCNGRKKVFGMGGMIKECGACGGTGWQSPVVMLCAPSEPVVNVDKRSKAYRELNKSNKA